MPKRKIKPLGNQTKELSFSDVSTLNSYTETLLRLQQRERVSGVLKDDSTVIQKWVGKAHEYECLNCRKKFTLADDVDMYEFCPHCGKEITGIHNMSECV